jgi:hypothetical protein
MAFRLLQVIYDWLAPGWGWGNPGTITAKGFPVVSTLGLYISSDQVGIATWSPHLPVVAPFSFIIPYEATMISQDRLGTDVSTAQK